MIAEAVNMMEGGMRETMEQLEALVASLTAV